MRPLVDDVTFIVACDHNLGIAITSVSNPKRTELSLVPVKHWGGGGGGVPPLSTKFYPDSLQI